MIIHAQIKKRIMTLKPFDKIIREFDSSHQSFPQGVDKNMGCGEAVVPAKAGTS